MNTHTIIVDDEILDFALGLQRALDEVRRQANNCEIDIGEYDKQRSELEIDMAAVLEQILVSPRWANNDDEELFCEWCGSNGVMVPVKTRSGEIAYACEQCVRLRGLSVVGTEDLI